MSLPDELILAVSFGILIYSILTLGEGEPKKKINEDRNNDAQL